jgi:hypothetical protein
VVVSFGALWENQTSQVSLGLPSSLHDESADKDRRDRMAIAAAPYVHPKLQVVGSTVKLAAEVTVTLTVEQRRQRARRAILEAFAERPPRVVEGEYEVIAERDIRVKSLPDKEEEPSS